MTTGVPEAVASFVATELASRADAGTKDWWTRYLKGEATFRGVKMADTRIVAATVNERFTLGEIPVADLFDVTDNLFARTETEDKLCAMLILAEHQLDRFRTSDIGRLAGPLELDQLADWNSCDWYCVKVLGPYIAAGDTERRARSIAAWSTTTGLWKRRAAAVSFVHLVKEPPPFEGFHELVVEVCERNVADPTRWSQTSVGWLMRELSQRAPRTVERFVSTNAERMSSEAVKAVTKHL